MPKEYEFYFFKVYKSEMILRIVLFEIVNFDNGADWCLLEFGCEPIKGFFVKSGLWQT